MAEVNDPKQAMARDLAAIDAVLNAPVDPPAPAPKPAPKPTKAAKRPAPVAVAADGGAGARVEDGDDFENDGDPFDTPSNAGARVPEGTAVKAAPVHVPIVPAKPGEYTVLPSGFPDINSDPELIAAIQNVARLEAQLSEAEAKLAESCAALNLKHFQHAPGRVEQTIQELMAKGADMTAVEDFDARGRLVRRLRGAIAIAQKEVADARVRAGRRLTHAAQEPLKETFLALHRARIPFARALLAHRDNLMRQRAAGFEPGNDWSGFTAEVPTYRDNARAEFRSLVERGILTADEVADLIAD